MRAHDTMTSAAVASGTLAEADRLMTVCNSCRYCEGLCAVFPAMEMRRAFTAGDLNYLANLCHSCGACYVDCQFSPPHEFNVNVPQTLAKLRADSYATYAWPSALGALFARNEIVVALVAIVSVAGFLLGFIGAHDPDAIFRAYPDSAGAFYALMPHNAMVGLFGTVFVYALVAMAMSVRAFWRAPETGELARVATGPASIWQAVKDAASLRYLDGGGVGCYNEDEYPTDRRRLYHHLTFYGFMACFASTSLATVYHYVFGWKAPYAWYDLPVLLGIAGGIGIVAGPIGLIAAKSRRDRAMEDMGSRGMGTAFLLMLLLTGASGLALLGLRETALMGITLALHLGAVFALFLTMPYGKFMHGLYRFAALVRYAAERRTQEQ